MQLRSTSHTAHAHILVTCIICSTQYIASGFVAPSELVAPLALVVPAAPKPPPAVASWVVPATLGALVLIIILEAVTLVLRGYPKTSNRDAEDPTIVDDMANSTPSGWGAHYFSEDAQMPMAQVVAAVTMLGPVMVEYVICSNSSCELDLFNGRPTGTGVLAYACLVPAAFANHLACAWFRRWIPFCQKFDRISVAAVVVLQCFACSHNTIYTVLAMLIFVSYAFLLFASPHRFRDNQEMATLFIGGIVLFGCCSLLIPADGWAWALNPYFFPAAASICAGFLVFHKALGRAWCDTFWHGFLTLYAVFTAFWIVKLEKKLYGC